MTNAPDVPSLTADEMAEIETIFLRHIDEDDAMSILQDLTTDSYMVVNRRWIEALIVATAKHVQNRIEEDICGS